MGEEAINLQNYSLKEYFELDDASDQKFEFEKGSILAMPRGSFNHSRIGGNIRRFLAVKLEAKSSPCEPFNSDARVYVKSVDSALHPDVVVFCDEIEYVDEEGQAGTNPMLIFEVLSKSTSGYDRGEKFIKYRYLPSLKEYVLVDQYEKRVEMYKKTPEGDWLFKTFYNYEGSVSFDSIGVALTFEEIYHNVKWDSEVE